MTDRSNRHIEIACELKHETANALLIHDGARQAWVPKSLIDFQADKPGTKIGVAVMPEWVAHEKGFI